MQEYFLEAGTYAEKHIELAWGRKYVLTLSRRCDPLVGHGIHEQCRPTVSLSDLCRFEYYLSDI